MASTTPQEVVAAQHFLVTKSLKIPARRFAASAKETGKSFSSLVTFIGRLYRGDTNQPEQLRERLSGLTNSTP